MRFAGTWVWAALAFLSELAAVAALAYWGFTVEGPLALRILLGVGLPVVAAVLWGLFAAPRAPVHRLPLVVATKVLVLGGAVLALVVRDHAFLAALLAVAGLLGALLSPGPDGLSRRS